MFYKFHERVLRMTNDSFYFIFFNISYCLKIFFNFEHFDVKYRNLTILIQFSYQVPHKYSTYYHSSMIIKIKNIIHESLNLYSLIFLRGAKIWLNFLNCKSGSIAIITVLIIYISINSKNGEKNIKSLKIINMF